MPAVAEKMGLVAYILSGWKTLSGFMGTSTFVVMRDIGKELFNYLNKSELVSADCYLNSLDEVTRCLKKIARLCGLPVRDIHVKIGECMIVEVEDNLDPDFDRFREDAAWVYLPMPLLSLLFYAISESGNVKMPYKYEAEYRDNRWVNKFYFREKPHLAGAA